MFSEEMLKPLWDSLTLILQGLFSTITVSINDTFNSSL